MNAVLRRIAREAPPPLDGPEAASANTPDWLWSRWSATYGEAAAAAIGRAHLGEPPLDLTIRDDVRKWTDALGADLLPTGSLRLRAAGPVTALPGFDDGAWWVQDAAAAIPARLFGDVRGRSAIDLCAAPGGKTAQLASAGAEVTAVDISPRRSAILRENLDRLRLAATIVVADANQWRPDSPADVVLVDAPCSATGTIRRHPDIPQLRAAADLTRLVEVQDRLLDAAVAMTRPGGTIVYATCSLEPEEGPARIDALRARGAPVALDPIAAAELPGLPEAIVDGTLRTLPSMLADAGGMDGFFAARLRRLPGA
ncbi:MAG: RsmB/NOP family class I SAM-dependent RNA methyltransferase [Alphaproteobacteria bacterium]